MRLNLRYFTSIVFLLMISAQVFAQEEALGREVTKDDWIGFMPIIIGSILLVIVVDAIFILPILRNRQNDVNEGDIK
jgi:hypothetical protein